MHGLAARVLLVGAEAEARHRWAHALDRQCLEVEITGSAGEALRRWDRESFDLVVVDASAHGDAVDLCRRLRSRAANPILLLMPDPGERRLLEACRAGADECIAEPVSPATLTAKVQAWLRHLWTVRAGALAPLQGGGLRLEPAQRRLVTGDGGAIALTNLELRLLHLLMSRPGQAQPPERIVACVWGPDGGGSIRLLRSLVHRLRRKIEREPRRPRYLRTVAGEGYAFGPRQAGQGRKLPQNCDPGGVPATGCDGPRCRFCDRGVVE